MATPPDNSAPVESPAAAAGARDGSAAANAPSHVAGSVAGKRPAAKAKAKAKPKPTPPAAPTVTPGAAPTPPPPAGPPAPVESTPPPGVHLSGVDAAPTPAGRGLLAESPSWLASLAVHLLLLLILALASLRAEPDLVANLLLSEPSTNDLDDLQDVPDMLLDAEVLETDPIEFQEQPDTDVVLEDVSFSPFSDATAAPSFTELSDLALTPAPASTPTTDPGFDGTGTTGRGRMARAALVRKNGGSQASEEAVADALNWIAEHQNPDGTWSLVHDRHRCRGRCANPARVPGQGDPYLDSLVSGTGLALLPYLGAGQTHKQGRHRRTVDRGLKALVRLGQAGERGAAWTDRGGNLYAHGIAAIALTEAYGMTRDKSLRAPAQAAVDYIVYAQGPGGGWRYFAGEQGDTSVTGWQVMALKSAYLAGLSVPPATIAKVERFLDSVQSQDGARYGYRAIPNPPATNTLSSVGLLCRMYMGWEQDRPALRAGVAALAKAGPSTNNHYYNYYGSQVLFQYTGGDGKTWRTWNRRLRQHLIETQEKTGHAKGSWYVTGGFGARGGRLYATSMATMCLEIYYRYMPIYQADAVERDFAK